MTKQKFRAIDIAIFSVITSLFEAVILIAFVSFGYREGYIVSIAAVMGLISIFRWNVWGIIPPLVSGVVTLLVGRFLGSESFISLSNILTYTVGNIGLLGGMIWFKSADKVKSQDKYSYILGYYFTGYLCYEVTRSVAALVVDFSNIGTILFNFFIADLLNICFGLLVVVIAKKQKVLMVDMNNYLIEVSRENETSLMRKDIENYQSLESLASDDEVSDIALLDGGMLSKADLEEMNATYQRMTNPEQVKNSKFKKEQEAVSKYKKKGKDDSHSTEVK